jgi:membrane-bound lytic murein transglycosylase MltF
MPSNNQGALLMRNGYRCVAVTCLVLLGWIAGSPAWGQDDVADHPLDAHLGERYTEDLDDLLERKYVRVLTTYNRTNFFLARGKLRGFEYGLLKKYQASLNKKISRRDLQIVFEFIPVARDRLLSGLVDGYGDIAAAGLTITPQRQDQVRFTRPYLTDIDEVLVTHSSEPSLKAISDLSGKAVFVRPSSSYHESLLTLNRQLAEQRLAPVSIIPADENLETEDILELVNTGAVTRTICDSHIATVWAGLLKNIRVHPELAVRKDGHIAWAVRKSSPQLKTSLDAFIAAHRKGTLLGNILFSRYYEKQTWIKNPLDGAPGKKLSTYLPIFKTYADRYDFDWPLIGAMAFQESRLDQDKISPQGAVGIMQIKPQTAADPQVGIPDVSTVENNVHAGVKYLAFLRSHYFDADGIRPRDQVRFSLAAYNAGPVKIRRARKLAREMNLDANRWFRNVELAMLRVVGQETVRYVSNVNKYYVIYRNAIDQVEKRIDAAEQMVR